VDAYGTLVITEELNWSVGAIKGFGDLLANDNKSRLILQKGAWAFIQALPG